MAGLVSKLVAVDPHPLGHLADLLRALAPHALRAEAQLGEDRVVGVDGGRGQVRGCRSRCRRSSRPRRPLLATPGTGNSLRVRSRSVCPGRSRSGSAVTRVKGLNDEPGWRWPLVARLKGSFSKSLPPTIALTPPVLLSITTTEAVGLDAGEGVVGGRLGGLLHVEVERRAHVEAAAEGAAGAVLVDELLAQPRGEVGGERSPPRASRCRTRRAAPGARPPRTPRR